MIKLPFSFAARLFFRLLLPGALLALFFYPAASHFVEWCGIVVKFEVIFPVLIAAFGWLMCLVDMPIYMLFEGRAFWPPGLYIFGIQWQARRLERLRSIAAFHKAEEIGYKDIAAQCSGSDSKKGEMLAAARYHSLRELEAHLKIAEYPLNNSRRREALFPTRLGNILAEHETYPDHKYGLDGVFFWYRIWLGLPKDLRDELDELQSMVDGALYISFVFIVGAAVVPSYEICRLVLDVRLVSQHVSDWWWAFSPASFVVSYNVYRLSLSAQIQYGRYFKALFDRFQADIKIDPVLATLSEQVRDPRIRYLTGRAAKKAVFRYLQWDRIRPIGESSNRDIGDFLEEKK